MKKLLAVVLLISLIFNIGVSVSAKQNFEITNFRVVYSKTKLTTLKWKQIKNATYQVFRSNSENGGFKLVSTVQKSQFKDKKISPGKTYFYKVRAVKNKTKGEFSKTLKVVKLAALKSQIEQKISKFSGDWGVYVKDLKTDAYFSIGDRSFRSASTIKLFTMVSTFNQIKNGGLKQTETVNNHLEKMITVSDNEGYNQLVKYHSSSHSFCSGANVMNGFLKSKGFGNTYVSNTLQPAASKKEGLGYCNMIGLDDCGEVLEQIYDGKCVSKEYSKQMLSLLKRQTLNHKIPSVLPNGTVVAHKTGETSYAQHDVGIVYSPNSTYVLCVLSQYFDNEYTAVKNIQTISKMVYDYLN